MKAGILIIGLALVGAALGFVAGRGHQLVIDESEASALEAKWHAADRMSYNQEQAFLSLQADYSKLWNENARLSAENTVLELNVEVLEEDRQILEPYVAAGKLAIVSR